MDVSYFVEDGTLRPLRLLIGRLPIIPRFPLFRDSASAAAKQQIAIYLFSGTAAGIG